MTAASGIRSGRKAEATFTCCFAKTYEDLKLQTSHFHERTRGEHKQSRQTEARAMFLLTGLTPFLSLRFQKLTSFL